MTPLPFTDFCGVLGVTLTRAQRVLAAVAFDGVAPRDLTGSDRGTARRLFGDVGTVPPEARGVLVAVAGARSGKSYLLGALYGLWRALVADLSRLAPGEQASAVVVAPDLRLARQVLRYVVGAARSVPSIASCIVSESSDSLVLRRPDGTVVAFEVLPATRGGSALRGRSLVSAVLDESAFFRSEEYQVNDAELFRAVAPRVMPGGMVVIASTPWIEAGLLHEEFQRNHGHPLTALACHAPTLLLRDGDAAIAAMVQRERERDPINAQREFDAQFVSGADDLLDRHAVECCVDRGVASRAPIPGGRYAIGLDLGVRQDASAIVVAHRELQSRDGAPPLDVIVLDGAEHFRPGVVSRLVGRGRVDLDAVEAAVVRLAREYGDATVHHDIYLSDAFAPRLKQRGIRCREVPMHSTAQAARAAMLVQRIGAGLVRLVEHPALVRELTELRVTRHAGGRITVAAPTRRGAHDDLADALLLAVEAAATLPACGGNIECAEHIRWQPELGGLFIDRTWRRRLANGSFAPCEPPAGTPDAEMAREARFRQGLVTPGDLADLGEAEVMRRIAAGGGDVDPGAYGDDGPSVPLPLDPGIERIGGWGRY